jgi:hypothetical protein
LEGVSKTAVSRGPGSSLLQILGCGSEFRSASMMNAWGTDECERQVDLIVEWVCSQCGISCDTARKFVIMAIERSR